MKDSTIWLTSDTHFNHDRDFIWSPRGFQNVTEMNEAIITKWNETVSENDIVYHLGDVIMGEDLQSGLKIVKSLKGQKILAIGNHDTDARIKAFLTNHLFQTATMGYRLKASKRTLILTHYPTITANGDDVRTINLFGHTHQTTNFFEDENGIRKYMYHVGVDSHNCNLVNLEEILNIYNKTKGE